MTATRLFDRAIVRLRAQDESEDVVDFLQGLVTNDVSGALPVYCGLLTPQGKTLFDFLVWPAGPGEILLDCEASASQELAKRLLLYRLRRKIEIAVDSDAAVHWQKELGDGSAPDPRLAELGQRWLAPARSGEETADCAWLEHRLSLGVPEGRRELGDILWLETNAVELSGVAFDKGCYIGQENTARMNWRQKVNRRIVVVPIDKSVERRQKAIYPDFGVAVDHLRLADMADLALPDWQERALNAPE